MPLFTFLERLFTDNEGDVIESPQARDSIFEPRQEQHEKSDRHTDCVTNNLIQSPRTSSGGDTVEQSAAVCGEDAGDVTHVNRQVLTLLNVIKTQLESENARLQSIEKELRKIRRLKQRVVEIKEKIKSMEYMYDQIHKLNME